ncbi:TRAP transporter large permease [Zavarzinia compransoris]|uniref:C4-dicarboxylate ABC transporter n=1 Tax=Zavarzinia compransoris TaxID=1264899 RepID=A0A317EA07_9PROT|nr:TRAP transporter large permease subunit [Zavarzinia compransoris]PWR23948.1 C4-dicarboxylate ABC transporter [Zavarzinia compransoris]TDP48195.1 tripartite ATP-independent transporter DctM subunit [Zavarzinia compransoris]
MVHLIAQNLAPIMFAALILFLLLGYPVAFALAANGLVFFALAVELAPFAPESITLSWPLLQALPDRVLGTMSNEVLLAIPFFTFMGLILERSGMAEDLLDTIGQLFGTIRGGLGYAVIFVGALLAATTGVVAASVISMGLISLPIMLRYGYDRRVASGVIAASGTLAQIIPPSLVLIVMADQLGRSVGDMYEGAFLPGILLAGAYALYIFVVGLFSPKAAPGLPVDAIGHKEPGGQRGVWQLSVMVLFSAVVAWWVMSQTGIRAGADFVILTICIATVIALICALMNRYLGARHLGLNAAVTLGAVGLYAYFRQDGHVTASLLMEMVAAGAVYGFVAGCAERFLGLRLVSAMAQQVTFVMVPPLLLIFLVLGTIFIGVATPTEGGAMGALGAVILAAGKRAADRMPSRFNREILVQATYATARLSAFVLFILIGARVFSLTFYGVNGHLWVEHLMTALPGGEVGFLILVNVLVFFLAFFLDYFELAFIVIPLLAPVANAMGIDLVWFGVMLAVNMQTSFMHPPFGFALFFLRSVAPKTAYRDRVTGRVMEPVTSGQIYWGAVPFVLIQLAMVAVVIAFPGLVTHYKAGAVQIDPAAVQGTFDQLQMPLGEDENLDLPGLQGLGGNNN